MRLRRLFLLVLVFCMLAGNAFGERSVCFYGFNSRSPGYTSFVKMHPGVKVRKNKKVYYNTKQILNDFITGKMPYDVLTLSTDSFDIYSLMGKGYLAPVTDNESIQSAMESMYAPFREQLSYEGVLYGVPYGCSISYYAYDPDAWVAAGFTAEDVPTSFTSYLDFLERWVLRIQEKPENDIRVCGYFDERQYGSDSYILYLVQLLMDQHILQSNYSNQPLRFDTDEFRTLLERCQSIGKDLYTYEPKRNGTYSLFTDASSLHSLLCYVPLRLTEDQPILLKATIIAGFINIRSQEIELSKEYLGQKLQNMSDGDAVYFYPEAQPVENENQKRLAEALADTIAGLETELNSDSLTEEERAALNERLEAKKAQYAKVTDPAGMYDISPEDLEIYKQYGDRLYFQGPSVFDPNTEDGQRVRRLEEQYALGEITTDQFVKELDHLAQMLELENE